MRGSRHEIVVNALANSGDGVGRLNNKVVFIPLSCPGDTLLIEITNDKKTFSQGRIVEILQPSPLRTEPLCPEFGKCGGCDWQHVDYASQIHWKRQNLVDVLKKIGKFDSQSLVEDIQPCSKPYHYRNRIQLHADANGFHYYQRKSQKPCYITQCPIASENINGWLQNSRKNPPKSNGKWELAETSRNQVELFAVSDLGHSEMGFRQVNTEQNQFLVQKIIELINRESIKSVLDLYCGQGNWSLEIARSLPEVTCLGIDINPKNIEEAKKMSLRNTHFLQGDVFEMASQWQSQTELTIIDPPRAGCSEQTLDLLKERKSDWLIYISCHPATMARDLNSLSETWTLETVIPVDMFPQTSHLESLAILRSTKRLKTANP